MSATKKICEVCKHIHVNDLTECPRCGGNKAWIDTVKYFKEHWSMPISPEASEAVMQKYRTWLDTSGVEAKVHNLIYFLDHRDVQYIWAEAGPCPPELENIDLEVEEFGITLANAPVIDNRPHKYAVLVRETDGWNMVASASASRERSGLFTGENMHMEEIEVHVNKRVILVKILLDNQRDLTGPQPG